MIVISFIEKPCIILSAGKDGGKEGSLHKKNNHQKIHKIQQNHREF